MTDYVKSEKRYKRLRAWLMEYMYDPDTGKSTTLAARLLQDSLNDTLYLVDDDRSKYLLFDLIFKTGMTMPPEIANDQIYGTIWNEIETHDFVYENAAKRMIKESNNYEPILFITKESEYSSKYDEELNIYHAPYDQNIGAGDIVDIDMGIKIAMPAEYNLIWSLVDKSCPYLNLLNPIMTEDGKVILRLHNNSKRSSLNIIKGNSLATASLIRRQKAKVFNLA